MKSISISNIMERLVARNKDAAENENGFSLLELVVAIGILLVLTVGGLIGYTAITNNARSAAATSAASEIATQIMVKESNDGKVNITQLVSEYDADEKNYKDLDISYASGVLTVEHVKGGEPAERTVSATNTTTP